jgi:hypothetical protein
MDVDGQHNCQRLHIKIERSTRTEKNHAIIARAIVKIENRTTCGEKVPR